MAIKLDRRTVLKGIGGTILALPLLEAMTGRKGARGANPSIPKRYIVCFGGQSMGADNDPIHNMYVPNTIGANYDLKVALAPLANNNNIKNEITVVSGLKIPTANGGAIPPGGRSDDFHINSLSPLLSGVRTGDAKVHGATSDQIVADALGGATTFKSLVYRVQASWYLDQSAPYGRDLISYRQSGTTVTGIPSTVSPRAAFDSLFASFTPVDPAEAARRAFLLKQRKSVLDLVGAKTEKLLGALGTSDKIRMQRHLDEVRDLERRISAVAPDGGGSCKLIADPGQDPAVGGNQTVNGGTGFDVNAGYSNEDERAAVLIDLMHMAIVCDLTRVASFQFTMAQSHMNMYPLIGIPYDLHEIGHSSHGTMGVSQGIAWHMKHFGRLVAKFRDTPEDIGTMLDNMAIVMLHEGGHGYDPSAGKTYSSHCTDNMACLIAGRAGGLKPGRHVVATDQHPANVLITAMNAVGVSTNSLGEVNGTIPALLA
ncbi:MAG TPA: DUF1552 domain-containing protein [Kofleriaceae bacterium]